MKLHNKKGFTLVEVLIVVAIIAILAAIAIPIFSTQMTNVKEKMDESNLRAAESLAYAEWQLAGSTGAQTYYAVATGDSQLQVVTTAPTAGHSGSDFVANEGYPAQASANKDKVMTIAIDAEGNITSAAWVAITAGP